jgi:curved DNA-binding protein CbpA
MTYYELLGVSSNATEDQIRQAYRAKVRRYHPDVNRAPNAGQLTALLNEAWSTLGDPRARAKYDRGIGVWAPSEWHTPSTLWPTPGAYTPRWSAHAESRTSSEASYESEPDYSDQFDADYFETDHYGYGSHPNGYDAYYRSTLVNDGRRFSFGRTAVGVAGALVTLAFLSSVFHWFPLVATAFLTIVFFRAFGRFWH